MPERNFPKIIHWTLVLLLLSALLAAQKAKMRNNLATLHQQVAELNMRISSLQDQNQALNSQVEILKDKLRESKNL
jgi:chaperonin cofactor prefoldin